MSLRARPSRWLAAALLAEAALMAIDIAVGSSFMVRSGYALPVLAIAVRAPARDVATSGVSAFALALATPLWNHDYGEQWVGPLIIVSAASAIATWGAHERATAEEERRQMRLLAEVARVTNTAADIESALQQIVDLLVPELADAAWVDLVDADGEPRRAAVRLAAPHSEELHAWLLAREARARRPARPTLRALRGEGSQLAKVDEQLIDAVAADAEDRRRLQELGARWTIAVPLAARGRVLGALGLVVGRSGRRYDRRDLAFMEILAGRAALVLGNAELLADLTATQRRLDGILGSLAEAVTVHDADGRLVFANAAAAQLFGAASIETVLATEPGGMAALFDLRTADGQAMDVDELPGRRVIRGEDAPPVLARGRRRSDGRPFWLMIKATLLLDADDHPLAVNVIEDVTEEREAALRQRFLAEAGKTLASSLEYEQTLRRVARLAVPDLADWCTVEIADGDGVLQQVAIAHVDPDKAALGRELRDRYPPDPDSPTGTPAVLRTGRAELYGHIPEDVLAATARDEEHLRLIRALQIRSAMVVPMVAGGQTLGVMTFIAAESGRSYTADDLAFAEELAARAGTAVENARLYTELRDVAHTLQASLLPDSLPALCGWEAAVSYRAGERGAEVGGDFYDVFALGGDHMFILGDVTGKGIAAAALTSLVRYTAKAAALFDPRPAAVLGVVNRVLREQDPLAPVTMVCGVLRAGEVTLAIAGHPLPLLKRTSGEAMRVGEPGLLLGAVDDYPPAREHTVRVRPGETLVLFTDGVTDTPGERGRFGDHRLQQVVAGGPADAAGLLDAVTEALDAFQRGTVSDDRAMLAVRRLGIATAAAA